MTKMITITLGQNDELDYLKSQGWTVAGMTQRGMYYTVLLVKA